MIFNHCLVCENIISHKKFLCNECQKYMENARLDKTDIACTKCGFPLLNNLYVCPQCKERHGNYFISIYNYRDSFAYKILDLYKFKNHKKIAHYFAKVLEPYLDDFDVIIPVPSSQSSIEKRGWDQMKLILDYTTGHRVLHLIGNSKDVSEQKALNRSQRLASSKEKFFVKPNSISKSSRILVVDDVTTTGSTMNACISMLKNEGFLHVEGFTFYLQF